MPCSTVPGRQYASYCCILSPWTGRVRWLKLNFLTFNLVLLSTPPHPDVVVQDLAIAMQPGSLRSTMYATLATPPPPPPDSPLSLVHSTRRVPVHTPSAKHIVIYDHVSPSTALVSRKAHKTCRIKYGKSQTDDPLTRFAEQRDNFIGDGDGKHLFPGVQDPALAREEHRRPAVVLTKTHRPARCESS